MLESRTLLSATVGFEDVGEGLEDESSFSGPVEGGTEQTGPFGDSQIAGEFISGGLTFNNTYSNDFGSWSGFAYSNTTDSTTPGFGNQLSSASGDGAANSETYGVAFTTGSDPSTIGRTAATNGGIFSSLYVNNTTYAALSMENGDSFAKEFGGETGNDADWFLLTIEGFNAEGGSVGTVDFYLADYRFVDNSMDYIVTDWTQVDISSIGNAAELQFSLSSSDNGDFGMNTPAYVAVDNIEIGTPDDVLAYDGTTGELFYGDSTGSQFIEGEGGSWDTSEGWEVFFGDFNGDGALDAAARNDAGDLEVSLNGTADPVSWGETLENDAANWLDTFVGDVNGDDRDDLISLADDGKWWVSVSEGSSFTTEYWNRINPTGLVSQSTGDFNGDGNTDIVSFYEDGRRWVAESTGTRFFNDYYGRVGTQATAGWGHFQVGDFNGDGRDDIMQQQSNGQWWRGTSNGNVNGSFATSYAGKWQTGYTDYHVADFTGDGLDDMAGRIGNNQWWIFQSQDGSTRSRIQYWNSWGAGQFLTTIGDFTGNGRVDIAGYSASQDRWLVQENVGGDFNSSVFGSWDSLDDDAILGNATS